MNIVGPFGTTPLNPEHSLPPSEDSHKPAQISLSALQKRTPKLESPAEETASDKEETNTKESQQRGGIASNQGDSGRRRGGRPRGQGRGS